MSGDGPPNIHEPHFDEPRDHPGFTARRARLGDQAGARKLGASLWELPPGEAAYPYHFHLGEEELLIVIAGTPSLRTADGLRELASGDVVSFPTGEEGAHQVINRTGAAVRFLALSTNGVPDITIYPDSSKVSAAERVPGGFRRIYRLDDDVDYHDGETPPAG